MRTVDSCFYFAHMALPGNSLRSSGRQITFLYRAICLAYLIVRIVISSTSPGAKYDQALSVS